MASCVTSIEMPIQITATILKLSRVNPHSIYFTHDVTCCRLGSTIPPQSAFPSSSIQIPPYSPFISPLCCPPLRARELGAFIIITPSLICKKENSCDHPCPEETIDIMILILSLLLHVQMKH